MRETNCFCDACGKPITEKRADENYLWFSKAVRGVTYDSTNNELCASCEKKFNEFLINFFKKAPVEWTKAD